MNFTLTPHRYGQDLSLEKKIHTDCNGNQLQFFILWIEQEIRREDAQKSLILSYRLVLQRV